VTVPGGIRATVWLTEPGDAIPNTYDSRPDLSLNSQERSASAQVNTRNSVLRSTGAGAQNQPNATRWIRPSSSLRNPTDYAKRDHRKEAVGPIGREQRFWSRLIERSDSELE